MEVRELETHDLKRVLNNYALRQAYFDADTTKTRQLKLFIWHYGVAHRFVDTTTWTVFVIYKNNKAETLLFDTKTDISKQLNEDAVCIIFCPRAEDGSTDWLKATPSDMVVWYLSKDLRTIFGHRSPYGLYMGGNADAKFTALCQQSILPAPLTLLAPILSLKETTFVKRAQVSIVWLNPSTKACARVQISRNEQKVLWCKIWFAPEADVVLKKDIDSNEHPLESFFTRNDQPDYFLKAEPNSEDVLTWLFGPANKKLVDIITSSSMVVQRTLLELENNDDVIKQLRVWNKNVPIDGKYYPPHSFQIPIEPHIELRFTRIWTADFYKEFSMILPGLGSSHRIRGTFVSLKKGDTIGARLQLLDKIYVETTYQRTEGAAGVPPRTEDAVFRVPQAYVLTPTKESLPVNAAVFYYSKPQDETPRSYCIVSDHLPTPWYDLIEVPFLGHQLQVIAQVLAAKLLKDIKLAAYPIKQLISYRRPPRVVSSRDRAKKNPNINVYNKVGLEDFLAGHVFEDQTDDLQFVLDQIVQMYLHSPIPIDLPFPVQGVSLLTGIWGEETRLKFLTKAKEKGMWLSFSVSFASSKENAVATLFPLASGASNRTDTVFKEAIAAYGLNGLIQRALKAKAINQDDLALLRPATRDATSLSSIASLDETSQSVSSSQPVAPPSEPIADNVAGSLPSQSVDLNSLGIPEYSYIQESSQSVNMDSLGIPEYSAIQESVPVRIISGAKSIVYDPRRLTEPSQAMDVDGQAAFIATGGVVEFDKVTADEDDDDKAEAKQDTASVPVLRQTHEELPPVEKVPEMVKRMEEIDSDNGKEDKKGVQNSRSRSRSRTPVQSTTSRTSTSKKRRRDESEADNPLSVVDKDLQDSRTLNPATEFPVPTPIDLVPVSSLAAPAEPAAGALPPSKQIRTAEASADPWGFLKKAIKTGSLSEKYQTLADSLETSQRNLYVDVPQQVRDGNLYAQYGYLINLVRENAYVDANPDGTGTNTVVAAAQAKQYAVLQEVATSESNKKALSRQSQATPVATSNSKPLNQTPASKPVQQEDSVDDDDDNESDDDESDDDESGYGSPPSDNSASSTPSLIDLTSSTPPPVFDGRLPSPNQAPAGPSAKPEDTGKKSSGIPSPSIISISSSQSSVPSQFAASKPPPTPASSTPASVVSVSSSQPSQPPQPKTRPPSPRSTPPGTQPSQSSPQSAPFGTQPSQPLSQPSFSQSVASRDKNQRIVSVPSSQARAISSLGSSASLSLLSSSSSSSSLSSSSSSSPLIPSVLRLPNYKPDPSKIAVLLRKLPPDQTPGTWLSIFKGILARNKVLIDANIANSLVAKLFFNRAAISDDDRLICEEWARQVEEHELAISFINPDFFKELYRNKRLLPVMVPVDGNDAIYAFLVSLSKIRTLPDKIKDLAMAVRRELFRYAPDIREYIKTYDPFGNQDEIITKFDEWVDRTYLNPDIKTREDRLKLLQKQSTSPHIFSLHLTIWAIYFLAVLFDVKSVALCEIHEGDDIQEGPDLFWMPSQPPDESDLHVLVVSGVRNTTRTRTADGILYYYIGLLEHSNYENDVKPATSSAESHRADLRAHHQINVPKFVLNYGPPDIFADFVISDSQDTVMDVDADSGSQQDTGSQVETRSDNSGNADDGGDDDARIFSDESDDQDDFDDIADNSDDDDDDDDDNPGGGSNSTGAGLIKVKQEPVDKDLTDRIVKQEVVDGDVPSESAGSSSGSVDSTTDFDLETNIADGLLDAGLFGVYEESDFEIADPVGQLAPIESFTEQEAQQQLLKAYEEATGRSAPSNLTKVTDQLKASIQRATAPSPAINTAQTLSSQLATVDSDLITAIRDWVAEVNTTRKLKARLAAERGQPLRRKNPRPSGGVGGNQSFFDYPGKAPDPGAQPQTSTLVEAKTLLHAWQLKLRICKDKIRKEQRKQKEIQRAIDAVMRERDALKKAKDLIDKAKKREDVIKKKAQETIAELKKKHAEEKKEWARKQEQKDATKEQRQNAKLASEQEKLRKAEDKIKAAQSKANDRINALKDTHQRKLAQVEAKDTDKRRRLEDQHKKELDLANQKAAAAQKKADDKYAKAAESYKSRLEKYQTRAAAKSAVEKAKFEKEKKALEEKLKKQKKIQQEREKRQAERNERAIKQVETAANREKDKLNGKIKKLDEDLAKQRERFQAKKAVLEKQKKDLQTKIDEKQAKVKEAEDKLKKAKEDLKQQQKVNQKEKELERDAENRRKRAADAETKAKQAKRDLDQAQRARAAKEQAEERLKRRLKSIEDRAKADKDRANQKFNEASRKLDAEKKRHQIALDKAKLTADRKQHDRDRAAEEKMRKALAALETKLKGAQDKLDKAKQDIDSLKRQQQEKISALQSRLEGQKVDAQNRLTTAQAKAEAKLAVAQVKRDVAQAEAKMKDKIIAELRKERNELQKQLNARNSDKQKKENGGGDEDDCDEIRNENKILRDIIKKIDPNGEQMGRIVMDEEQKREDAKKRLARLSSESPIFSLMYSLGNPAIEGESFFIPANFWPIDRLAQLLEKTFNGATSYQSSDVQKWANGLADFMNEIKKVADVQLHTVPNVFPQEGALYWKRIKRLSARCYAFRNRLEATSKRFGKVDPVFTFVAENLFDVDNTHPFTRQCRNIVCALADIMWCIMSIYFTKEKNTAVQRLFEQAMESLTAVNFVNPFAEIILTVARETQDDIVGNSQAKYFASGKHFDVILDKWHSEYDTTVKDYFDINFPQSKLNLGYMDKVAAYLVHMIRPYWEMADPVKYNDIVARYMKRQKFFEATVNKMVVDGTPLDKLAELIQQTMDQNQDPQSKPKKKQSGKKGSNSSNDPAANDEDMKSDAIQLVKVLTRDIAILDSIDPVLASAEAAQLMEITFADMFQTYPLLELGLLIAIKNEAERAYYTFDTDIFDPEERKERFKRAYERETSVSQARIIAEVSLPEFYED